MNRNMKTSSEPWIGLVPSDWDESKIKYVAPIHNERAESNEGYIGLENIEGWTGKLLPSDSTATGESISFLKDDVLFGKLRPYLAKSVVAHENGCGSTELLVMRPENINPNYLGYICRSKTFVDCIDVSTYGAKMPRANGAFIGNLHIPMPSEIEQRTIVSYLDSKCSAIDEAIERHKKIIEKLEEYRKAEISREMSACTKAIPAKRVFMIYAGATPKSGISKYWDGEINWITPADYKTEDHYITSSKRQITEEGYASCNTTIVPENSIIVSKRAPIGTVGIASVPLCTNQGCLSCVPYNNAYAEFYYYALIYKNEEMQVLGAGTTFQEISAVAFSNMKLPYADINTQKKVASRLVAVDTMIQTYREKHLAVIEKLEEYRKSIIYNTVTGKIDCRTEAVE